MNTDMMFCSNKSCKIRQYCKRGVDIRESDLLISYDNFNCMVSEDNFFIDLKLPIVVYEFNQALMNELAELRKFKLDSDTNQLNDNFVDFNQWLYAFGYVPTVIKGSDKYKSLYNSNEISAKELYKIYTNDRHE